MEPDSTLETILLYLKNHHTASPGEIAKALNLTGAAVRYHLSHLRNDGRVESVCMTNVLKTGKKRGRPAQMYQLSAQSRPNNTNALTGTLLRMGLDQDANIADFWMELAHWMVGTVPNQTSLNRRLANAVETCNQMRHEARWEAGPQGPRIIFNNCPYRELLPQFPGLCQMDGKILGAILHRDVEQTAKITQNASKFQCIFEVMPDKHKTLQSA